MITLTLFSIICSPSKINIIEKNNMADFVKGKMELIPSEDDIPNYFRVTDLVNPAQYYYYRNKFIRPTLAIRRKLAMGTKLHEHFERLWLNIDGFERQETLLDGVWVGYNVVGKYDLRFRGSIIEIKTKSIPVDDPNDIFSFYPQDLEQLLYYVAISASPNKNNYLVFITDVYPYDFSCYCVSYNDLDNVRRLLSERIDLLSNALITKEPSILGRCRYYEHGCQYNESEVCKCKELEPLPIDKMKRIVTITKANDFEEILLNIDKSNYNQDLIYLNTFQILFPRVWYEEKIDEAESNFHKSSLKTAEEELLNKAILDVEEFKISHSPPNPLLEYPGFRVQIPRKYLTMRQSGKEPRIVPYLGIISELKNARYANKPHDIPLSRLAITCACVGVDSGVIFVHYPYLNRRLDAFYIEFQHIDEIREGIIEQLKSITKAKEENDIELLDPKLDWML